jgi:hypothetical protein
MKDYFHLFSKIDIKLTLTLKILTDLLKNIKKACPENQNIPVYSFEILKIHDNLMQ